MVSDVGEGHQIYTIGFTKKDAKAFFGLLQKADIHRLIDVRINNRSQLAGFAKRDDLKFFLDALLDAEYEHREELAPTKELLNLWRDDSIEWEEYERRFRQLLSNREIEENLDPSLFDDPAVLLCSEHQPDLCHRRLIIEYLDEEWGDVAGIHLTE